MSERLPQDERLDRRAHVPVPDLDVRMAAGRQALARRRAASGPSWRPAGYAAAASVAIAAATLLIVLFAGGDHAEPVARVEPGEAPSSRFALPDGSTIVADADADVELLTKQRDLVRIALHDGTATFDVTRDEQRRFVVVAGDVEVRVLGTRFSVTHTAAEVSVAVTRGLVEVAIGDDVRRLAAGERWSRSSEDDELATAEPSERRGAKRARRRAPRAEPAAEPAPTAADDFEAAVALRRDGSAPEAARAFAAFLAEHPSDGRAPLAAFELGRLRMDVLGDRAGAVTALERAVRTTPSAPFRQDALARLVQLYDDLGRTAQCARARDQYLDAYPTGPHAAGVRGRCDR